LEGSGRIGRDCSVVGRARYGNPWKVVGIGTAGVLWRRADGTGEDAERSAGNGAAGRERTWCGCTGESRSGTNWLGRNGGNRTGE
jgi:hypothetical protein